MKIRQTSCRILQGLALLAMFSVGIFAQSAAAPANDKPEAKGSEQSVRGAHSDSSYVIGSDDVLAINVWKEPDVSRTVTVRSDGKISLPLAGELTAGSQTPLQLEQEISKRLSSYISEPEVTVIVQDSKSQKAEGMGAVHGELRELGA